jgi:hypothetical protein
MPKRKYELTVNDVIEKWASKYPKVMTWLSKLQRKQMNAWQLWFYCKAVDKTPDELLTLKSKDPSSKDAEYLLDNFLARQDVLHTVKLKTSIAVKSFYKHNYCDLARACGQISFEKQKPYRKHTKEEMLKIYRSAQNPRDRALITFVWSSAIARESLTKIQWKHLEPDWEKQEIPHIGLPSELIKGHGKGKYKGVEQHTFLTPEAKRDLIEYKDWLERVKGVEITAEMNIWIQIEKPFKPLYYNAFSKIEQTLSRTSGVPFSWHDARRYVETALEEIKIHPNWARKIRGRKVRGEEAPYSRPAIDQLRKAFREAVPLLEFTQPTSLMQLKERQEVVERLNAKMMEGQPLNEKDKADMKRHGIAMPMFRKKAVKTEHNGGDCGEQFEQIKESQLLSYLKAGWTIVKELQNGEVIVRRQSSTKSLS